MCDYYNDCGDNSDESSCVNRYMCSSDDTTSTTSTIQKNKLCDGVFDCPVKDDECSEFCKGDTEGKVVWRMISSVVYRVLAITIAIFSLLVNFASLGLFFWNLKTKRDRAFSILVNDVLVALIALGDFMVGIYLLLVFSYDQIYGDDYCSKRLEWLSSDTCSFIGVVSTFGNQLSLLSMTLLSIYRLVSIKTMMIFSSISKKKLVSLVAMVTLITVYSLGISVVPILRATENYFVNGLYLPGNPIVMDAQSKSTLASNFKAYTAAPPFNGDSDRMSWDDWRSILVFIFDGLHMNDSSVLEENWIVNNKHRLRKDDTSLSTGFYGNSGVCLFKFFVKNTDPQYKYSIFVLVTNLICFVVITISYAWIISHTRQTSKDAGTRENKQTRRSMLRLQRKISMIIATDFVTWIPFIILAFFHYNDIIDGDSFYEFCSILLIPINSLLNPIIYNSDKILPRLKLWGTSVVTMTTSQIPANSTVVTTQPTRDLRGETVQSSH